MTKLGIAVGVVALIAGVAATFSVCYGQSGGMMGRGGMMGHGGISGRWHHVRMHGLPKNTSKMSFETRGRYIFETACADCHGQRGRGGVRNPNYEHDTVPALDELADSMGIFRQEDADVVLGMLEKGVDPASKTDDPPFRGYARFIAQYDTVRDTIANGREAAKKNPKGRAPQEMPDWAHTLNKRDIDAVIAYIIRLYDFPEPVEDVEEPDGGSTFP